ncbi:MAG: hypothetical protein K6F09_02795 [Clostridiales bacterium]|nr:hypothetical protein [Clostridiales bacterium]
MDKMKIAADLDKADHWTRFYELGKKPDKKSGVKLLKYLAFCYPEASLSAVVENEDDEKEIYNALKRVRRFIFDRL